MKLLSTSTGNRPETRPPQVAGASWSIRVCALALLIQLSLGTAFADSKLDQSLTFDIPANTSMEDALIQWGLKAGLTVMINANVVDHRITKGLHGTLNTRSALLILLRESGLAYSEDGDLIKVFPEARSSSSNFHDTRLPLSSPKGSDARSDAVDGDDITNRHVDGTAEERSSRPSSMQTVLVTAQKREEQLQDVPIAISVLTGKQLDGSTFLNSADALSTLPAVATAYDLITGETLLEVRGVSASAANGAGASTAAYYIDSVPFGFVNQAAVPDANLYDLQRIEVLNGPQGTLYGANALNGVIRILTNDADLNEFSFKGRGSVSTTDGGGVNYNGDMAVNIPIIVGRLATRMVVGEDHESGWIDSPIGNHINDTVQQNARIKLDAKPIDSLFVGLSAWHQQTAMGASAYATTANFSTQTVPAPEYHQFNAYGLKIEGELPFMNVSSATSYIGDSFVGNSTGADGNFPGLLLYTQESSHMYSEELNITSRSADPWRWSAGAFYRKEADFFYQTLPYGLGAGTAIPSSIFSAALSYRSTQATIYGELTREFFDDRLEITAGARYFHDNVSTQPTLSAFPPDPADRAGVNPNPIEAPAHATTPRAVLTWKPKSELTIYASYAQGFRSGIPQQYAITDLTPFPAAKPDKLSNYEIGIKGEFLDHRLAFTAATYYMSWKDVQQQIGVPLVVNGAPGIYVALINGVSASGEGAEFQVIARPVGGLDINTSFSWNNLHFDRDVISGGIPIFFADDRPANSPAYTAAISAAYTFPLFGVSGLRGQISGSENYTSNQNETNLINGVAETSLGNSVLLARAHLSVLSGEHWTTSLFVNNAANWHGNVYAYNNGFGRFGLQAQPRTIGLMIEYRQ